MAAAGNNLSRRAVLGAAFAAPAVLAGTAEASPFQATDRRRWDRALTVLRRAEAAVEAFRIHHMHPADRAYHAVRGRWPRDYDFSADAEAQAAVRAALAVHEPLEERLSDLECVKLMAIKRLLLAPAPDIPALVTKIALAVDYEVGELENGERCMALLKADSARLLFGGHRA